MKNYKSSRKLRVRGRELVPGRELLHYHYTYKLYCSASEVRHPSEVRHLCFMTILKSFYCPVTAYMYILPLEEAIPFI